MKVSLCYPSLLPGVRPKYGLQPLGVLYLAAVLRRAGFEVEVLDADIEGLAVAEMAEGLLAGQPVVVGASRARCPSAPNWDAHGLPPARGPGSG